jgi:predicted outer membrane repeat protein
MKRQIFLLFLGLTVIQTARPIIINVPLDQPGIQAGIDATNHGDTVLVAPGHYLEGINFNGKNIVVGSQYIITGDTALISQTVIDANKESRVVIFENREDSSAVLNGFSIINGNAGLGEGGGVYCTNSKPTLLNLLIYNNNAGWGGALYCHNYSDIKISDSKIYNNAGGLGGGIHCIRSSPIIKNTQIFNNSGNGMYCWYNSSPVLIDVTITGNSSREGGGIYCQRNCNPVLSGVTISRNRATWGGGVYLVRESSLEFDTEDRCSIYLNTAKIGADIFARLCPPMTVVLDTFTVTQSTHYYASPRELYWFEIQHGLKTLTDADLYVSPQGNDANTGLSWDSPLQSISQVLAQIDTDGSNPRTIYLAAGIYGPSATGEKFPLNLFTSLVGVNKETTILDGEEKYWAILCNGVRDIAIENLTIQNGKDTDACGIRCNLVEDMSINHVNIYACKSSRYGGGLHFSWVSGMQLNDVDMRDNSAAAGGGIYCYQSNMECNDLSMTHNYSVWDGAGINLVLSRAVFKRTNISHNNAPSGLFYNGGGLYCLMSDAFFINSVVSHNNSGAQGGGIFCLDGSRVVLVNSIFWNNTPQQIFLAPPEEDQALNEVTVYYSDVQGGEGAIILPSGGFVDWLEGNIDTDPLFLDAENNDFQLQKYSPCIDQGVTFFVWENDTLLDLTEADYRGSAPDMGAYEFGIVTGIDHENSIPVEYCMFPAYPNPFNPITTIAYELPKESTVKICIYNLSGQLVQELLNEVKPAGYHTIQWDASSQSSGVYFYQISAGEFRDIKKCVLLK